MLHRRTTLGNLEDRGGGSELWNKGTLCEVGCLVSVLMGQTGVQSDIACRCVRMLEHDGDIPNPRLTEQREGMKL